jgi:hypothetical protein
MAISVGQGMKLALREKAALVAAVIAAVSAAVAANAQVELQPGRHHIVVR